MLIYVKYFTDGIRGSVKCTQGNCFNNFGLIIGDSLFLSHGSERHPYIIPQISRWIAFNIQHCLPCYNAVDNNGFLINFFNFINIDTGTEVKAETLQCKILKEIKKALNIDYNQRYYTNFAGIKFDFNHHLWTTDSI